jgi:hypothetical protein
VSLQLGLLDGPEYSEQQLEAILKPLYPPLWLMIHEPFQDLLKRRATDGAFLILTGGETAQWLRPQIVHRARELCRGIPDLEVQENRNQVFLNYRNEIAITPKKFKRKWMSKLLTFSSYSTQQNKDYWFQREVDGFPRLPRVIVGYKFVEEMTGIKILAKDFEAQELIDEDRGFSAKPKRRKAKRADQ